MDEASDVELSWICKNRALRTSLTGLDKEHLGLPRQCRTVHAVEVTDDVFIDGNLKHKVVEDDGQPLIYSVWHQLPQEQRALGAVSSINIEHAKYTSIVLYFNMQ